MSHVRALTGAVMLGVVPTANAAAFIIGTSQIGTGVLGEGPWEMVDVSDRCRSIETDRGRSEPFGPLRVGQAVVEIFNNGGEIVPTQGFGSPGYTRPGAPIVVAAQSFGAGPHVTVFTGIVDSIVYVRNQANTLQSMILECSEVRRSLAEIENELGAGLGDGELTGARIERLLDQLDPPPLASERDIDPGTVAMAQTFDPADPHTLLEDIRECEFIEGGAFFTDRNGRYAFRDRNAASGSFVFDAGDTAGEQYRTPDLEMVLSNEFVINDVTIGRAGASAVRVVDNDSISLIGRRTTFKRVDLPMQLTADVQPLAEYYLDQWTTYKFARDIEFTAVRAPWADLLPVLEVFDRVKVRRHFFEPLLEPVDLENERNVTGKIQSIRHRWSAGNPWRTVLAISTSA